jgi:pimeloyl-ACP methyl ester carboxylesterase
MAATLALDGEARDRRIAESFASWLGRHSERKRTRLADHARALVGETSLVADMRATPALTGLETIACPVLALYGERSDLRERGERALATVPGARVEIVDGCTHSILWEATTLVRQRLLEFVAEVIG